ncbi:dihydrolipoamide acyltransferase [Mycobacterium sp. E342]|uniref:lipoyl domain-containing protein n=1 Tax=unclassified Mycobacterium TaxID=2642494 RepID=UPI00080144EE|nr:MULTISPECIES: lipoyl domain-containing protein [unclassified Mycobacterium]OBH11765.1 dihydrolipoamide acyltransferase [Mycobacterium sp. E3247]OBH37719.1 dihydrolipoamide acyltransferase [Mycobacterium sp. E342]
MPFVYKIKIPKLGMAVEAATLSAWLVEDGQTIAAGEPLYVAATDKVDQEITSPVSGVVKLIGVVEENYPAGTLIAEITAQ